METATAARRCGMRPVVYLGAIVEPQPNDVRANLLLDIDLGAEIHILPSCGRSTKETMEANDHLFQAHIAQLAAQGIRSTTFRSAAPLLSGQPVLRSATSKQWNNASLPG